MERFGTWLFGCVWLLVSGCAQGAPALPEDVAFDSEPVVPTSDVAVPDGGLPDQDAMVTFPFPDAAPPQPDAAMPPMDSAVPQETGPTCVPTPPSLSAACAASCEHLKTCQIPGAPIVDCAQACLGVGDPYLDSPSCLTLLQQFHECAVMLDCSVLRSSGFAGGSCAGVATSVDTLCPAPEPGVPLPCS